MRKTRQEKLPSRSENVMRFCWIAGTRDLAPVTRGERTSPLVSNSALSAVLDLGTRARRITGEGAVTSALDRLLGFFFMRSILALFRLTRNGVWSNDFKRLYAFRLRLPFAFSDSAALIRLFVPSRAASAAR